MLGFGFQVFRSRGRSGGTGPSRTSGSPKLRVRILGLLIVAVSGLYIAYLFKLQVLNVAIYTRRARSTMSRVVVIPPQRGEIFDRNRDQPLAVNIPSFAIEIVPGITGKHLGVVIDRLARELKVAPTSIWTKLRSRKIHPYEPVEIESNVPLSTVSYIAERLEAFPGVIWRSRPARFYPVTGSISHVVGYVGDITPQKLQVLYNEGYSANSAIGKDGVEQEYDRILRGRTGRALISVDAAGRQIGNDPRVIERPVNGDNLVLTIDRHIQRLAERALGPRMGSVVVLRPSTGAILALVSYPWYNPNAFEQYRNSQALRNVLRDPHYPLIDRAIQSAYAPASTFKIIMTTADYDTKAFPPDKTIDTVGSMYYGGRIWHDWNPNGFGPLDLAGALAESCDQYFWTIGTQYLGIDRIDTYASDFRLGEKTGIDLPDEIAGLLPTPEWKQSTFAEPWVGGDTMDMSIGQGYLQVTPIQMADVAAMVANGGVVYRPHVLKEIRDPNSGRLLRSYKPEVLTRSQISPSVFREVSAAMRGVITHGTANVVITTKAVKIAAKTGTGQVGRKDHFTSWFVSFGPYDAKNPADRIVVVVMEEATNKWDWWAPKAASIIYQGIFAHENFKQAVHSLEPVWYLNSTVIGNFDQ